MKNKYLFLILMRLSSCWRKPAANCEQESALNLHIYLHTNVVMCIYIQLFVFSYVIYIVLCEFMCMAMCFCWQIITSNLGKIDFV